MTNSRATRGLSPTGQKNTARKAVALALATLYRCGYFVAFPKCSPEPTTDLVFLGVGCDTAQRRFYVPEDKLRKLDGSFGAFSVFKAAADFPAAWRNAHINVKETFALHEVLKLATTTHPGCLKGSTAVVDVDNKTMHDAFKKGRSRNTLTHDLITKLFWLQVKEDFTRKLRWVCSEANWAADSLTRPERTEYVRLSQAAFDRLWETWGGVDMDLMATYTSAQSAPIGGGLERQNLPFYSRLHTNNTAEEDVFSHNVNHMPGSLQKCFGYYSPQPSLVGVVLAHMCKCQARAAIVVSNTRAS